MGCYCENCGKRLVYRKRDKGQWYDKHTGEMVCSAELVCPNKRHWWDWHFRKKADFRGDGFGFPATDFDKDGIREYP